MRKNEINKIVFEDILYDILSPIEDVYYKISNVFLKQKYKKKSDIFERKYRIYYKQENRICSYSGYSILFSSVTWCPTYHFSVNNKNTHEHDFETVLKNLYFYPESFEIADENEYSKQELEFIEDIRKMLLEMGFKDCKKNNEPVYDEYLKRNCKKNYYNVYYYNLYANNKEIIEKKKRKIKKILRIIFIIIVLWLIMFLTDIICINKPVFMINKNNVYYGLFYKIEDNKIGTYFMKNNKQKFKIIDNTKTCNQEKEKFYEDENNEYYFSCTKSANIKILYENKEYNLNDALKNKIINVDDLSKKVKFITKIKTDI